MTSKGKERTGLTANINRGDAGPEVRQSSMARAKSYSLHHRHEQQAQVPALKSQAAIVVAAVLGVFGHPRSARLPPSLLARSAAATTDEARAGRAQDAARDCLFLDRT
jgi:hypothetical protein